MKKFFVVVVLMMCQFSWSAQQPTPKFDFQEITKSTGHERGTVTIYFFFTFKNGQKGICSKYLNCNEPNYSKQYSYAQSGAFVADDPADSWYRLFHAYDASHGIKKK